MILKTTTLKTKLIAWFEVVAWACLIFAFSNQANSGEITGRYLGSFNVLVRKCGHMSEYAVFFLLLRRALLCTVDGGIYDFVVPFALSVLYAISDEFHQSFVAGRSASAGDVAIDTVGALLGFGALRLWLRLSRRAAKSDLT